MRKLLVTLMVAMVVAPAGARAATTDRARPVLRYTTADGEVLLGTGTSSDELPTEVRGTATDAGTGIARVEVWAVPCTTRSSTSCAYVGPLTIHHRVGAVALSCNSTRRSCSWRAPAPRAPGRYWVAANAIDRAGNESYGEGIISVLVV